METNKARTISFILFSLIFMFACINKKSSSIGRIEVDKQMKEVTNLFFNDIVHQSPLMRQTHSPPLFTDRHHTIQVQGFVSPHIPADITRVVKVSDASKSHVLTTSIYTSSIYLRNIQNWTLIFKISLNL